MLCIAAAKSHDGGACESDAGAHASPSVAGVDLRIFDQARAAVERLDPAVAQTLGAARSGLDALSKGTSAVRARVHFGRTLALLASSLEGDTPDDVRRASALRREAVTLWLDAERLARIEDDARWRAFALLYLSEEYARAKQQEEASRLAAEALRASISTADPDLIFRAHVRRYETAHGDERDATMLESLRAARGEIGRLSSRLDPRTLYRRSAPVLTALADRLIVASRASASSASDLLLEAQETLEILKIAEIRDYFSDACLGEQEMQRVDEIRGARVLYPILLDDRVELLVVKNGLASVVMSPMSPDDLRNAAQRLMIRSQDVTTNRYRPTAAALFDGLIRPVIEQVVAANSTLVIVPPPELLMLPFAALWDSGRKDHLVERTPIALAPSIRLTRSRSIDPQRTRTLVAGLTRPVPDWPALTFVDEELESVERSFPGDVLRGADFTESTLASQLEEVPYGIIHIATHGLFDTYSADSFIVTDDGRMSMSALASLVRRARFRNERPVELLALSACETAVGDRRAFLGLSGVAIQAGARSALGTLWKVNDEATQQLMEVFYRELAREGISRSEALRRAQVDLLRSERFRHPTYWAPFLMINSWL